MMSSEIFSLLSFYLRHLSTLMRAPKSRGRSFPPQTNEFGFRCLVVGYEPVGVQGRGLRNLEMELAYLGGLCAASLMRRNLALPNATSNGDEMEAATVEEAAADAYDMHPALLSKGFALDQVQTYFRPCKPQLYLYMFIVVLSMCPFSVSLPRYKWL